MAYEYTDDDPELRRVCDIYLRTGKDDIGFMQETRDEEDVASKAWPEKTLLMFTKYYSSNLRKNPIALKICNQAQLINHDQAIKLKQQAIKLKQQAMELKQKDTSIAALKKELAMLRAAPEAPSFRH